MELVRWSAKAKWAALLFAVSGVISNGVFVWSSPKESLPWSVGVPFAILCAVLCVRPWPWIAVSAPLQCLAWVCAFRLACFQVLNGDPSLVKVYCIPGALGAVGVAIAASIRRPWRAAIRVAAGAALLGAVGGAAFFLGALFRNWLQTLPLFVIWQVLVGTWLFVTSDTRQNGRDDGLSPRIFPGVVSAEIYKLGWLPGGNTTEQEHRQGHRFECELTNSLERLKIGPEEDAVRLMLALAECLATPVYVLYVLHVPRAGAEAARYESPPLDRDKLEEFIWTFSEFFRRDARHDVWISAIDGTGLVVLDSHGLLFAYGPLERYTAVMLENGLKEGPVAIPFPHTHRYHEQFDADEVAVLRFFDWGKSPLKPGDGE